ncbi:MAG: SufD family Fe-S cluster assembly protein [Eubacterium sp.]|nr:SufD family Fe-S cluster assembly protein [Eubacterium sp.]
MKETINKLPSITWNWLKMNQVDLDVPDEIVKNKELVLGAASGEAEIVAPEMAGAREQDIKISVNTDENRTIVIDFASEGSGFMKVRTSAEIAKGGTLKLVEVFRNGEDYGITDRIDVKAAEKSGFELVQIFIRGKETYSDVKVDLEGQASALKIDTAYLTTGDNLLDINYEANHIGEMTLSDISVMGALCDRAEKRFRGTIDFRNGSIGAKGNEIENVLVLDSDVVNKTIPVILCAEEDVEGNHGATIGKLDKESLDYMMSRGLSEEVIREMMKTAYIISALKNLPDEELRERILKEEGLI